MNEKEMNRLAQACLDDGEWQIGTGEELQPGPSHQPDVSLGCGRKNFFTLIFGNFF